MAKCILCMKREAEPRNGGLCYVCAPPLTKALRKFRHLVNVIFENTETRAA